MAKRQQVGFDGMEVLNRKLRAMESDLRGATLVRAVSAGAGPIETTAARLAPRRTGRLAQSMRHEVVTATKDRAAVNVGTNVFYALFVELGLGPASPKPFLRPAFDAEKVNAEKKIRAELLRAVLEVARGS